MKEMLKINIADIDPYVRLVQHVTGRSYDYYVPWRIIYDFELMFIVSGQFRLKTSNAVQDFVAGDFLIIPPFLRHKQEIPDDCECSYFATHMDFCYDKNKQDFSWNDVYIKPCEEHYETGLEVEELNDRQIYEPIGLDLSAHIHINDFDVFYDIFNKMHECFIRNTDISKIEVRAYANLLIASFFRELDNQQDKSDYAEKTVNTFANYVSKHFAEKIDLVKLSQQYGFTPNYFRKIFKQITNSAPNEYLINLRIEEAKKLLQLDRYTVQTVCLMVGYDDVHYFSRLFKKKEGISPAQYSKYCKEKFKK